MIRRASRLELFEPYREDIENNNPLPQSIADRMYQDLRANGYNIPWQDPSGKFLVKTKFAHHLFMKWDLLANSPGYTHLETKSFQNFFHNYELLEKAQLWTKIEQPKNYIITGASLGTLWAAMVSYWSGEFNHGVLAFPLLGGITGNYLADYRSKAVLQRNHQARQNFFNEVKNIKVGWSALEAALQ